MTPEESLALSRLRQWANEPERLSDLIAECVRVLLAQLSRLADKIAEAERARIDLDAAERAVAAYRCENARLRTLINDATPAPWEVEEREQ